MKKLLIITLLLLSGCATQTDVLNIQQQINSIELDVDYINTEVKEVNGLSIQTTELSNLIIGYSIKQSEKIDAIKQKIDCIFYKGNKLC